MKKCIVLLYLSYLLVRCVRESESQRGHCTPKNSVLRFCTDGTFTNLTDAVLDTSSVPKYQETVCECTINPLVSGISFKITFYDKVVPKNMYFRINNVLISSVENIYFWNTDRAKLILFTTQNYTTGGTCLVISAEDMSRFDISCKSTAPVTLYSVTKNPTSVTPGGIITETSEENFKTQGLSETKHNPVSNITDVVVSTVIGVLLVIAAAVIAIVFIKRRRRTKETNMHEHDEHHLPELGNKQCHRSNANNVDNVCEIPVNEYERLNMYVNESLAGEMYQQLDVDKIEKYQEMNKAKCNAGNQNRHFVRHLKLQESDNDRIQSTAESINEKDKRQGNDADGGDHDLETSATSYERLNLYVNDNLAGNMYEQLDADQTKDYRQKHIPCDGERPGHKTLENEILSAVYTNALVEEDE